MLKKLDNSFSISMPEFIENAKILLKEIDVDKEFEKFLDLFKGYLNDDKFYDDWIKYIYQQIRITMPKKDKNARLREK